MASGSDKHGAELISPPSTHKSPIWEHFRLRFTEENGRKIPVPNAHATCKHCFVDVSYKSWSTSGWNTQSTSPVSRVPRLMLKIVIALRNSTSRGGV